jgi:uncharacterized membrane protein
MTEQGSESCRSCPEKHKCQEIYEELGKAKGPSVALKAVAAFLVPLVVFIGSLAAFEKISDKITNTKALQTIISFLLALSVTFVCILVIKAAYEHQRKRKLQ